MSNKKVNIISGVGLTALLITTLMLAVAGCDKGSKVEVEASVESNFEVGDRFNINNKDAVEVIDKDTGVHYLVVFDSYSARSGISITPLYNVDGSLKVKEE